jgi:hypothetical protein
MLHTPPFAHGTDATVVVDITVDAVDVVVVDLGDATPLRQTLFFAT